MKIVNFPGSYTQVGASGVCPFCGDRSLFFPVTSGHAVGQEICNAARCESCKRYVLVVGDRRPGTQDYSLVSVYPEGAVNDTVDEAIPKDIKKDFQEALRCMGVNAFKATVAMCGRAIQASAIQLGASGKDLVNQIDDMAAKGIITNPLKEMAHDIRITRNVGVHPDKDGL